MNSVIISTPTSLLLITIRSVLKISTKYYCRIEVGNMKRKIILIGIISLITSPIMLVGTCKGELMIGDILNYKITKSKI
jgi:hypothetical protein